MDSLYPQVRPQQPVSPYWMGDGEVYCNERWEVVQGDTLAFFIQLFCDCPTLVPDITGYTFAFVVKASLDSTDPNELLIIAWTEYHGACACTVLVAMPQQTASLPAGRYAFDVKYRTPGGSITTLKRGELDVLPSTNIDMAGFGFVPPPNPGLLTGLSRQAASARLAS